MDERRGRRGIRGYRGERGPRGSDNEAEVIGYLERIENKTDDQTSVLTDHGQKLAVIEAQVKFTNGRVTKNCLDIDQLFKLNNEDDKRWATLNAFKYIAVILGIISTLIAMFAFFVKQ